MTRLSSVVIVGAGLAGIIVNPVDYPGR